MILLIVFRRTGEIEKMIMCFLEEEIFSCEINFTKYFLRENDVYIFGVKLQCGDLMVARYIASSSSSSSIE